jgi:hypothetical protein
MDKQAIINALRNGAQAASNGVADQVAFPVDAIAGGLRGIGLAIPENPVMGSQWMRENGLTAQTEPGMSTDIGYAAGTVMPMLPINYGKQIKEFYDAKDMMKNRK